MRHRTPTLLGSSVPSRLPPSPCGHARFERRVGPGLQKEKRPWRPSIPSCAPSAIAGPQAPPPISPAPRCSLLYLREDGTVEEIRRAEQLQGPGQQGLSGLRLSPFHH